MQCALYIFANKIANHHQTNYPSFFQEAKLQLVPSGECQKLQSKGASFLPSIELCAGNKINQKIDAYTYHNKKGFERVPPAEQKQNTEVKYGMIDACLGEYFYKYLKLF